MIFAAQYLHLNLTVIKQFSSHLEFLQSIHMEQLPSQVLCTYQFSALENLQLTLVKFAKCLMC